MQEQTASSKWWKQLASLGMISPSTIFEMNLMEVWQSSQTWRSFFFWSEVPGSVLMSPSARISFSLWWYKWNPTSCMRPWHSLQFHVDFNHLRVVLILYYNCMHLIILFNPSGTLLFLHTSFLSLAFNILRDACYQEEHRYLIAAYNPKYFQNPIWELV